MGPLLLAEALAYIYAVGKTARLVGSGAALAVRASGVAIKAGKITFAELKTNGWARAEVIAWGIYWFDDEFAEGIETLAKYTFPELAEEEQASIAMAMLKFITDAETVKNAIMTATMLLSLHPRTLSSKIVLPAASAFAVMGGRKAAEIFSRMRGVKGDAASVTDKAKSEGTIDWLKSFFTSGGATATAAGAMKATAPVLSISNLGLRLSMRARAFVSTKGHRVKIAMEAVDDVGKTTATMVHVILARNPIGNWVVTRVREHNAIFNKLIDDVNGPGNIGMSSRDLAAGLAMAAASLYAAQKAVEMTTTFLAPPDRYNGTSYLEQESDEMTDALLHPERYTFYEGMTLSLRDFASYLLAQLQAEMATSDLVGAVMGKSDSYTTKAVKTRLIEMALEDYERGEFSNMRDVGDALSMAPGSAYSVVDIYHSLLSERVRTPALQPVFEGKVSLVVDGSADDSNSESASSPKQSGGGANASKPSTPANNIPIHNPLLHRGR